jgi:hypothetical protein
LKINPCVVLPVISRRLPGRGAAAEVAVFEPVAVSLQGDDVSVVDEPVDHRGGSDNLFTSTTK